MRVLCSRSIMDRTHRQVYTIWTLPWIELRTPTPEMRVRFPPGAVYAMWQGNNLPMEQQEKRCVMHRFFTGRIV